MNPHLLTLSEFLFRHCYPLYRPLYTAYKTMTDREERALLRQLIRPGMVVADIGANIGFYTRYLASLAGPDGHVYAFEPSSVNFARLQQNTGSLDTVTAVQAAVGDHSGRTALYLSEQVNVDHQTYDGGQARQRVEVAAVSLDDYFAAGSRVDVLKVDVQGGEYGVLKGATRLLRDNPQMMCVMEFWPYGLKRAGTSASELRKLISACGLKLRAIGENPEAIGASDSDDEPSEAAYCNILIGRQL